VGTVTPPSEIRYARTTDGIDIAYTTFGEGPRDVVLIHGFTTHLDFVGDCTWHVNWLQRLGERCRVIQLDKRGTGLSDRTLGHGSIEERMRDVLAVMDAVGSYRASIVGISEGGPIGLTFAGTYPGRVDKLVLYGTFARLMTAPDYPIGVPPELADPFVAYVAEAWGKGEILGTMFISHAPDVTAAARIMSRFERNACTRQMAVEILRRNLEIDVRALLPGIAVPTLVMHNSGDPLIPVAVGRYLAENIGGAEYEEADGDYHCTWLSEEFESLMDRAVAFLCDETVRQRQAPAAGRQTRGIATVLFTDIVSSTDTAVRMGDGRWREVLAEHDRLAADATRRAGGRVVKSTGDGMLALFDGPSRAIDAIRELRKTVGGLDLHVRAGIHTGEIERSDDDVSGVGVHIAARVMALASPDEIVASRTVKDLAAGSGILFVERGAAALKGIPGEWELYTVGD
jgi:class 3 adenylate cyclase